MRALMFRKSRRLVTAGALLVLMAAILPNIMYLGHWSSADNHVFRTPEELQEHIAHCHVGPSHCAASQASSDAITWVAGVAPLELGLNADPQRVEFSQLTVIAETQSTILKPPPRIV